MSSSTSSSSSYSPSINAPPNSSPPPFPSSSPNSPSSSPTISNSEIKNTKKLFPKKFVGQENHFEAIARLAGIDDQEVEEINKKEIKEELKEITKINDLINNEDNEEKDEKLNEMNFTNNKKEIPINSQSCNNLFSSSSRRKNGNPTRMIDEIILKNLRRKRNLEEEEENEKNKNKEEEEEENEDNNKSGNERIVEASNENKIEGEILGHNSNNSSNECPPPLPFEGLFSPSYATDINRTEEMPFGEEGVEQQQRKQFYTQLIQQYGNNNQIFDIQRKMANYLKEDLNGIICSGAIDKVLTDISSQELHNNTQTSRFLAALQQNVRQQQFGLFGNNIRTLTTSIPSFIPHSSMPLSTSSRIFSSSMPSSSSSISLINSNISPSSSTVNPFQTFLAITQNPLIATAMAAAAAAASFAQQQQSQILAQNSNNNQNGIFPSSLTVTETNKKLNFSQPRSTINLQKFQQNDGCPRKKRQKVTDSVRGPRSNLHCREPSNNYSTCERLTPNGGFVMPTMVPQQRVFCSPDRNLGESPSGDDSGGDNNNYIANNDLNKILQLTHVHLRKAKLMFFYQRYPSSSVLKSYFPDVQFNKHNTAQLVKWFSNFREFYYMQMEKFAKQALAEGVNHQEELIVTTESEIFKQLNQHYNKNNVFEPPERLLFVVQETLREFFSALQQQKDLEPSWKKSIYKIIQQLDEPIPDYFRDFQFVEMLENAP
uniref:Prospero domain-containing protein n=2 Tax=Meloidogyne TaxID=189290 RepID=A0A914KIW9_MELIC